MIEMSVYIPCNKCAALYTSKSWNFVKIAWANMVAHMDVPMEMMQLLLLEYTLTSHTHLYSHSPCGSVYYVQYQIGGPFHITYRVIKKKLTQNEINIKNTSDKNVSIKYAYTDRQNCFLSRTKTIMCFHCSVQKIWLFM